MVKRHNRLLVALYVCSDAVLGIAAFVLAYVVRFESGLIPVTKGLPAVQPVRQRAAVHRACWSPLHSTCRGYIASDAADRASTTSSRCLSAASSPSSSASSPRCTSRRITSPDELKDRGALRGLADCLGAVPLVQRPLDVRVARAGARGAGASVARRHRPQADTDCRRGRAWTTGRRSRILEHRELGYHVVGFVDDRAGRRLSGPSGPADPRHAGRSRQTSPFARLSTISMSRFRPEQHVRMLELLEVTSREILT